MSNFVVFLHVASAALLMGGAVASRLAERAVGAANDLATLRGALDVLRRMSRINPALALLLLASGAWLGRHGMWATPWFLLAVASWFANLILVARFVLPHQRTLGMAVDRASEGPVPPAVDAQRSASAPAYAHDAMIGLDFGVLVLMIVKPGMEWARAAPVLGAALMVTIRRAGRAAGASQLVPAAPAR